MTTTIPDPPKPSRVPQNADEALARLQDGNARYAEFKATRPDQSSERRAEVAGGQDPWAVVWGCVDSRVPPEIIFDQGLGDFFVVRTAGQASDNTSVGSVEFGVAEFNLPLVVILGHENCGAVGATIDVVESGSDPEGQIAAIVDAIRPAVEAVQDDPGDLTDNAVRANVAMQVEALHNSSILREAVEAGTLTIVGARYDLGDGTVEFFDA